MSIRFLVLGVVFWVFFWGGGSADFIFMGAWIFLNLKGTKNRPEVFQTEVFSWTSARDVRRKMLVFPAFGGPDRSFWPDVRRDIRPKTSSLG